MNQTALKKLFTHWREWEFNPIVIKELRQGVRSWTVTGMLMLFLVVLFITSLGFLVTQSFDVSPNMQLGGSMFSAFVVILTGASVFFIPLYTGVRVAMERVENNHDLLYVTTLSPTRIIFGKFLCSAYLALLFFSACMPFMAFTNLLRGVDLPSVFFILAFLFLVVCAANMVAIFLACLPMSRPFKFLFAIYGIFQSLGIIGSLVGAAFLMMRSGVGAMMSGRDFWIGTATVVSIGLMLTSLFFVLSVALISPPSANRALPVRLYITAIWLFSGLLGLGWVLQRKDPALMLWWTYPTFALMLMALLVTISNSDALSLRVRNTIPGSRFKRFVAFLFFNGAAGGLVWVVGLLAATYFITWRVSLALPRGLNGGDDIFWLPATLEYALDYGLTALFIQRKFFPNRPPKIAGLIAVLLAGGWAITPSIFLFFTNRLSWNSVDHLQLGNIFNVFSLREDEHEQRVYHLYAASAWLAVAVLLNLKWFGQQVKYFRPPVKMEKPPVLGGVPPAAAN